MVSRNLSHLSLRVDNVIAIPFQRGTFGESIVPFRNDKKKHSSKLGDELATVWNNNRSGRIFSMRLDGHPDTGIFFDLLDKPYFGMELLSVKEENGVIISANIRVDSLAKLNRFRKAIKAYGIAETDTALKYIGSIESISDNLSIEDFFMDDPSLMPEDDKKHWWQIWLTNKNGDYEREVRKKFIYTSNANSLKINENAIVIEDRIIFLCRATKEELSNFIPKCNLIAEIHIAKKLKSPSELDPIDQRILSDELKKRIVYAENNNTRVVVLDSNFIARHPLLENALLRNQKAMGYFGAPHPNGHATEVASLALLGNLTDAFSQPIIALHHKIEAVQVFDENENHKDLYGKVTENAIELTKDNENSSYILTVTEEDDKHFGKPTEWSGYLDKLIYKNKKVITVSAGNFSEILNKTDYEREQLKKCMESPSQSWNALTIGGYTELCDEKLCLGEGTVPYTKSGDLSPYTRTSATFDSQWPIKPDVVFEAGNAITADDNKVYSHFPLHPTVCSGDFYSTGVPFSSINATSAATGISGKFIGELMAANPNLWPETIRGLVVHSADWTEAMTERLNNKDTQTAKTELARLFGYGLPNLEKAKYSSLNSLCMIAQKEFIAYDARKDANGRIPRKRNRETINNKQEQVLFFKLPWPKDLLRSISGDKPLKLTITLSYFVDARPSNRGYSRKYTYPSHNLRFDLQLPTESNEDFFKRINQLARDEQEKVERQADTRWYYGKMSKMRTTGSIHKDIIKSTTGAELSDMEHIAVYSLGGWWKDNKKKLPSDTKTRFSLIVEIDTGDVEIDLYNPIKSLIEIENVIENPIEINI